MRGKAFQVCVCSKSSRITPAYAGKRALLLPSVPRCRDHPRVCGEKYKIKKRYPLEMGSPPRMRGKVVFDEFIPERIRITPAYAGKSGLAVFQLLENGDHPRVCGEKSGCLTAHKTQVGSPPRMRGKVFQCFAFFCHKGDHPRVCGEKEYAKRNPGLYSGSPPRMRGKVLRLGDAVGVARITPAYAGKSTTGTMYFGDAYGSPPRMRGKALPEERKAAGHGITPAYAGKSF